MKCSVILGLAAFATASTAVADSGSPDNVPGISDTTPGISPEGALAPISIVEGPGLKLGEGTVLHPIFGVETGFISNVFYEESDPVSAGILRLVAQIGTGSLSPQRLTASGAGDTLPAGQHNVGSFQYRLDLRLSYDLYLSDEAALKAQNGLGIGALFRGAVFPQRTWSFLYLDNFQRQIRATNFESTSSTNRDINRLQLGLQFAPGGRAITSLLHYENVIDYFEDEDQQFANRMQNLIGLTVSWRALPVTVFFADVTQGFVGGLGSEADNKNSSYPLTATVGAQTQLTLATTLVGRIGYTNGFYADGPSFSALVAGVQFGYRYMPTGRITALYDYNHQDSINANFFRDHHFRVLLEQQFFPFVMTLQPEIRFRRYEGVMQVIGGGPDTRDDLILSAAAGARYNFRQSFAGVLEYRFSSIETDYRYMASPGVVDDPSYVRHEIVLGVRAAL